MKILFKKRNLFQSTKIGISKPSINFKNLFSRNNKNCIKSHRISLIFYFKYKIFMNLIKK